MEALPRLVVSIYATDEAGVLNKPSEAAFVSFNFLLEGVPQNIHVPKVPGIGSRQ